MELRKVTFGNYEVYEDGQVFSLKRRRFLCPWVNKGYKMITLDGKQKTLAHVLIEAFHGVKPFRVQFKDMNTENVSLNNLSWR